MSQLQGYLEALGQRVLLFDVPLLKSFSRISFDPTPDLRTVFKGTLLQTFVTSHDTQRGQSMDTPIAEWFVPIAYALILLRADTGTPCVFYGDAFGTLGPSASPPACGGRILPMLLRARKAYAHGRQIDYLTSAGSGGFVRAGGVAVVMNLGWEYSVQRMSVGTDRAGEMWVDVLAGARGKVVVGVDGNGDFWAGPRGVAVWANGSP